MSRGRSAAYVLLLSVLVSGRGAAEESSERVQNASIVVTFEPQSVDQERVVSAIKAHVSGLPVQVLIEPVEHARSLDQQLARSGSLALSRGALGTFSIEFGAQRELLLFFTEPGGNATLVRRLPPSPEGPRVTVEQAAIVVRSLVEALLEGGRIGIAEGKAIEDREAHKPATTRNPAAPRKPAAARKSEKAANSKSDVEDEAVDTFEDMPVEAKSGRAPGRRHRLGISGAYTGALFASSTEWESGFTLGARGTVVSAFYGSVRYTFFPRVEGGGDPALVSITRRPIELVIGYLGRSLLAPNAELGLIGDFTSRETLRTAPGYRALPSVARWMFALGARAGATWSATSMLNVSLRGGVDVLLMPYSYAVAGEGATVTPNVVRPRLELELELGIW